MRPNIWAMPDLDRVRKGVGRRIAKARHAKSWSQNELARHMGGPPFIESSQVSRWERGLALPELRNLGRLADALEVDVEAFFHDDPDDQAA